MTATSASVEQPTKGNAAILVGALVVFALVFGGFGLVKYRIGAASTSWPTADGRITASRVESTRSNDTTKYRASVTYTYSVDGRTYSGGQISSVTSLTSRGRAEAVLARYPNGAAVTVHYDPEDPGSAVLEPGAGSGVFVMLAVAVGCLALALLILVSALRRGSGG